MDSYHYHCQRNQMKLVFFKADIANIKLINLSVGVIIDLHKMKDHVGHIGLFLQMT